MRFLADMGISQDTVDYLLYFDHGAIHLREQGLQRMSDPDILEKARQEERILLTHDLGFGDLLAASGTALPSVITFRLRDMRPANVNRHLKAVLREHQPEFQEGAIVSVTEGRSRVRALPISP